VLFRSQNLTSSVIQPIFGYYSDRISVSWLLPCSVLLSGLGMAAMGLAPSYYLLLVAVIFGGLGIAGYHPQSSRCAHFVSSSTTRGRNMGIFSVGGNLGFAVGSIFMTFLLGLPGVTNNTIYFFLPAAFMSLLLFSHLKLITPPLKVYDSVNKTNPGKTTRPPLPVALLSLLLLFIFVRSSIHTGLMTYIPLYYVNYLSGSPMYASYLLSAFLLSGVVGTFMGGVLSDRFGRKPVIILSMLVTLPLISLLQYTTGFITLILLSLIGMALISSFATTMVLRKR
jgi:FSR family fosmidomycin resistance protein-like MFS transporter